MANSLKARCGRDLLTANSRLSNSFAKQTKNNDPSEKKKKTPQHQTNFIVKAALPFTLCSGYIVFSSNEAWIHSKFSACRTR